MNVFVTGATGTIGRPLVARLVAEGFGVRALVRAQADAGDLASPTIEIVRGDMRDPADVSRAIAGCGLAFHLAVDRSSRDAILAGAANVADAAARAGVARIVFTSSTGIYRRVPHGRVDEDTPTGPDPGYHTYQAEAERILLDRWSRGGSPVVIARVTSLGPGSPPWRGVFQAVAGGSFRMVGDGSNRYQPIDVSDVVEGLLRCATVPGIEGRVYILAGAHPSSLREIIHAIEQAVGVTTSRSRLPVSALRAYRALNHLVLAGTGRNLPRHDRASFFLYDRSFDVSRAQEELGFTARVGLQDIVRRAVDSYRKDGLL